MITSSGAVLVSVQAKLFKDAEDKTSRTVLACAKAVYIQIAMHCGPDLVCYPSHKRLIELTFFSKNTVIRAIDWLVCHGYVRILERGRPGRNTTYQWVNRENIQLNGGDDVPVRRVDNVKSIGSVSTRARSIREDLGDRSWAD